MAYSQTQNQGGHRRSEDGNPAAGSRGGAPVRVWRRIPQKPNICSLQLSDAFLRCRVRPPYPLPRKKTSDLRESHEPTWQGQSGHVVTRGYATAVWIQATSTRMSVLDSDSAKRVGLLMPRLQLRFDYDPTTTYRARLLPVRREQKMNMSIFRRSRIAVRIS